MVPYRFSFVVHKERVSHSQHETFLFLAHTVCYLVCVHSISKIDLSVAVPVCSFSYILIPLASIVFLHEKVSLFRWSGVLFILLGVVFVSLSASEKERALE